MKKEKIYQTPQVDILQLASEQDVFSGSVVFSNEDYDTQNVQDYEW